MWSASQSSAHSLCSMMVLRASYTSPKWLGTERSRQRPIFSRRVNQSRAWVVRCDIERRRLGLTIKDPANNPWLKLKERLPIGDKLTTRITSVVDLAFFVELGEGLEGLVHVSDFTWGPSESTPAELYSVGQEIDVMLLDVDVECGRANLGIKQLSDPADGAKFEVDAIVVGRVTNIQSYGVFVDLGYGKEGMIHVDTLGDDAGEALAGNSKLDQEVSLTIRPTNVKVMAIDEEDQPTRRPHEDIDEICLLLPTRRPHR